MDYCQWCQTVLEASNHFYQTDTSTRMMGPDDDDMARLMFGNAIAASADYFTSRYRRGLLDTLDDLAHCGLLEDKSFGHFKIQQRGREYVTDPLPLWETICATKLEDDGAHVLRVTNQLGFVDHGDQVVVAGPPQDQVQAALGWDDWDRLYSVVSDLERMGLIRTEGTNVSGPHYWIIPTFSSAVWELKRGLVAESRRVDELKKGGETTNIELKREVHTDTKDDKAELMRDLLGLVTTKATGPRFLLIGFDWSRVTSSPNSICATSASSITVRALSVKLR